MLHAQKSNNIRHKIISYKAGSQKIDSLSIIPGTFKIIGVHDSLYYLDESTAIIYWKQPPSKQLLSVEYRVFPLLISAASKRISYDTVMYKFLLPKDKITGTKEYYKPFDFGKLSSNGSLGRSLSFGNRQDAVLNSSLNLQMNGYIGDSILLSAAISDNNIPIQPDGNTQNLKEFDQVYLKFSKDSWRLSLGDLDLRENTSPYLNFYKRLQGVSFENTSKVSAHALNTIMASGAVAKGKFTRNVFQGTEGNQGPYRLKGANQEMFFIVLAGTERVFLDGVQQQRGEDQDYVINYNTGEITFTSKQMITKDKRIQIEFEYADRNYLNSQFVVHDDLIVNNKLSFRIGLFDNTDAKNSPVGQSLTSDQRLFMSSIGDNLSQKYYSSAVADSFSANKILYKQVDSVFAPGKHDTIFVHASQPGNNLFALSFMDLGEGKGNYVQDYENNTNGKVYKWIAPDQQTGISKGRYEPVVLLALPKSQKLITWGTTYQINAKTKVDADVAASKYDMNRLSLKDKSNDNGFAFKTQFNNQLELMHDKLEMESQILLDYTSTFFKPIERLRDVEFYRDWGMDLVVTSQEEKYVQTSFKFKSKQDQALGYSFDFFNRTSEMNAVKHAFNYRYFSKFWKMDNQVEFRNVASHQSKGKLFRPTLNAARVFPQLGNQEIGIRFHQEQNDNRWIVSDSLSARSFLFKTFEAFTQSDQNKLNKWSFSYYTRSDDLPIGKKFTRGDQSQNFNVKVDWLTNDHHQFRMNTTWRMLNSNPAQGSLAKNSSTLIGRAQYLMDLWRSGFTGDVLYEVGSGQEPRRDFSFIEVPAGQGEYTWIDYNNDGVQQLTEFEIAKFKDQAKYFRISTPTSSFIRADYLQNNLDFVLDPEKPLKDAAETSVNKFLKRFYLQSSLQLSEKKEAGQKRLVFPSQSIFTDTSLIAFNQLLSTTFSFNRKSQVWGIDINTLQSDNRSFLSYGYETRKTKLTSYRFHLYFLRVFTADLTYKLGVNRLETSKFNNRTYNLTFFSYEPKLTYTPNSKLRLMGSMKLDHKLNITNEETYANAINLEAKYNIVSNTALSTKITVNKIKYSGTTNSILSYIMLDGLLPGRNMLWNIDLSKNLSRMLKLSFQYEGRKAGNTGIVNIGRAQVTALL